MNQPERTSEAITSPEVYAEMLAEQQEKVAQLHAELDSRFGKESGVNLTGETLVEADALAYELQNEAQKLNDLVAAYATERMQGGGPRGQVLPPAANDQRAPIALTA